MVEFDIIDELLDSILVLKSDLKPSQWYEKNMVMPPGETYPGPISYDRTPFWKEPVDCFDPNHPATDITIMGPAQMGKSIMVLNPVIGYTIALNPCNIIFLTGHSELSKEAMMKIEFMIDNCGLKDLIKPQVLKAKNNRTGDTLMKKEFPNGSLIAGSITNHNLLRQNTATITIGDDLDAGKLAKEETGSTIKLIIGRTKARADRCKRAWVSSPQNKGTSLIEVQWELSDKRLFFVECEHCHEPIDLRFHIPISDKESAGLAYKMDDFGRVDPKSVVYVCQLCSHGFSDKNKHKLLNSGFWKPTCVPQQPYHYGYKPTGLLAPHGMTSWAQLCQTYHLCNLPGLPRNESDYKTFLNIDIGDLYEEPTETLKANELQKNNVREYEIGAIPEGLSLKDGNGEVVLVTLQADCNGKLEDARLDWELEAWTETGARYSFAHGSIGTFIPYQSASQKEADIREKWSYDLNVPNSVWTEFHKLVSGTYNKDNGGEVGVFITSIDVGHCTDQVFSYIDSRTPEYNIIGVMGDKEHEWQKYRDVKDFVFGRSRPNLYLLNVNKMKDDLARQMRLKWDQVNHPAQPYGFMNFPNAKDGKYDYKHYFIQFEAEEKKEDKSKGAFIWEKKSATSQNHWWDVKLYGRAAVDVLMEVICKKEMGLKSYNWKVFVDILMGRGVEG